MFFLGLRAEHRARPKHVQTQTLTNHKVKNIHKTSRVFFSLHLHFVFVVLHRCVGCVGTTVILMRSQAQSGCCGSHARTKKRRLHESELLATRVFPDAKPNCGLCSKMFVFQNGSLLETFNTNLACKKGERLTHPKSPLVGVGLILTLRWWGWDSS